MAGTHTTTTSSSSVHAQLASWLGQTPRLEEYAASLMDIGCDTPQMLPFLTEEQLREAGVAPLHAQSILTHAKANSIPSTGARAEGGSEGSNESDLGARLADLRGLYEGLTRTGSSERVLSEVRAQIQQMEDELEAEKRSSSRLELFPDQRLGQGQFPVFAASWTGRGDTLTVAAKRLPLDVDISREVAALIKCEHQNVVRYYALERDDNFQYLVMEKCEGNLSQMIQSGALRDMHAREDVCLQLCEAVAYVHSDSVGLAHRDIKPANVLYCTDGCVKLCDFGLAKISAQTVQAATLCGTVAWMAPEVLEGAETIDLAATDIFSLGCLLYYTLTLGGHPFHRGKQGWGFTRSTVDLSALDLTAQHLVEPMLREGGRPSAHWCCAHPLFWTAEKAVDLCHLLRESLQTRHALKAQLDRALEPAVAGWPKIVSKTPGLKEMSGAKPGKTPFHFLVTVRNAACHPGYVVKGGDKSKKPPFASKDAMCTYFKEHFPDLALTLCEFVTEHVGGEEAFGQYCLPAGTDSDSLTEALLAALELDGGVPRCSEGHLCVVANPCNHYEFYCGGCGDFARDSVERWVCKKKECDTDWCFACCPLSGCTPQPKQDQLWYRLGIRRGGNVAGRIYSEQQCYEESLTLNPECGAAWHSLARVGGGNVVGKIYSEQRCLEEAPRLDPQCGTAWHALGDKGGGSVGGVTYSVQQCYEEALRLDPGCGMTAWSGLGEILAEVGGGEVYTAEQCYVEVNARINFDTK